MRFAFLILALAPGSAALPLYDSLWLGVPAGARQFDAYGMNNLGQVVGQAIYPDGRYLPTLWSGGQFYALPAPGANYGYAAGINDSGQIIGYFAPSISATNPNGGALWTTSLSLQTFSNWIPRAINDNGVIVGFNSISYRPQISSDGVTFNDIAIPAGIEVYDTFVNGLNNGGVLIGGTVGPSGTSRYWSGGSIAQVPYPVGYDFSISAGVNDAGVLVGSMVSSTNPDLPWIGYRFDGSVFSLLPTSSEWPSVIANGINNDGIVVGQISSGRPYALAWEGQQVYDLATRLLQPLVNGRFYSANLINDVGQIAAYGSQFVDGETTYSSYLLTPVTGAPEPATCVLTGAALVIAFAARRYRKRE